MAALALAACGQGEASGPNTISGSVDGTPFSQVAAAYWIGKPAAGSPPVILFLLEQPMACAEISVLNWDKTIGESQVLEIGLSEASVRSFTVPAGAYESYLRGFYNPDADAGTVTVTAVNPSRDIAGSFAASYRTDSLRGTFDAAYCATGVEP